MCYATGAQSICDYFPQGHAADLIQAGECSDGNCAAAVSLPYAALLDCGQMIQVRLPHACYWFSQQANGTYALVYPAEASATLNVTNSTVAFQARGESWNFHGFGQSTYPAGALDNVTRDGRTYSVAYNTSSQPVGNVPPGGVSSIAQSGGPENYQFAYNGGGQLTSVTLTRQLSPAQNVACLAINYFASGGKYSNAGDLESRQSQVYDAQSADLGRAGHHALRLRLDDGPDPLRTGRPPVPSVGSLGPTPI